ncbi:10574_t:CDS:2 [Entrophospora sp. SA101]|nr:4664_t:CDS:2 [Entrophospora sp. SA101]CAJ0766166.1 10574_t:CDS:2 [Entrophospora sp. SA101]CAJ0839923.1 16399_t:CDS:2 [Entrophospora sp. SA101]CAJ0885191.1 7776_t:CDS:2 [Entrophospora sp. SA101]CAJ0912916.1 17936_t:CDS:2 [Entrophospora sp. SA101]
MFDFTQEQPLKDIYHNTEKQAVAPLLDIGQCQLGKIIGNAFYCVEPVGKYFLRLCTTTPCENEIHTW